MNEIRSGSAVLETERLLLRPFSLGDLEAIYEIFRDQEVNRVLPWFTLESKGEARAFYEARLQNRPGERVYAICLKEENLPIGYVTLGGEAHDLGYGLRKAYWGRGLVTEACRAVLAQLKAEGLPFVTATHDVQNLRSGAVMGRLGLRYCYSYEEQWQPKDVLVTFRLYQLNLDGQAERVYRKYWEESTVHFIEEGL